MFRQGAAIHAPTVLDLIANEAPRDGQSLGRICIVTGEIAGPDFNGGIGTANRGMALALQNAGFTVDVLYTRVQEGQPFCFRGRFEEQVAAFRALGINLMCIDHKGMWDDWLGKSLRVLEALQAKQYDIAFFDDTHGTAYYSALARRTGNPALAQTRIVLVTHSATQWICDLNQAPVTTLADVRLLEIERRSIELADYVVSPSAYILKKYQSYGWTLPRNTIVRPNILPFSAERAVPPSRTAEVGEIVFFGRLERRKGLWLFCEALDRLKYELAGRKVTFLGKFTHEDGESTGYGLLRRSAEWPFAPTLLYNYDRDQALAYLKGESRLAVMPSREDNSPCVILECLIEGIPFIASSGSGGQELIREQDHKHCLFEPTAEGLTAKLRSVLHKGIVTAQPSFSPRENARQTISWVSDLVDEVRAASETAPRKAREKKSGQDSLRQTIFLLAPEELSPEQVSDGARETASRNAGAAVVVFCEDVAPLQRLAGETRPLPKNLRFCRLTSFAEEAAKARKAGGLLLLSRLDQPVPAALLARADVALRTTDIGALTAMRGQAIESLKPDQPFVWTGAFHWEPEQFLTGNTSAVLLLAQDSNAGVLILRAELADVLTRVSPRDAHLCRLKNIELFIHEVLLDLAAGGHGFELLPDVFLPAAAVESSQETYGLPRISMHHLMATRQMQPGRETTLLSRLAVEKFASEAGKKNAQGLLGDLVARLGSDILDPKNFWPPAAAFAIFAKVAHASGRPDLALSFIGSSITTDNPLLRVSRPSLSDIALREAQVIELAAHFKDGRYSTLNLDHPWSLRTDDDGLALEIHPNGASEGDATLIFNGLPLGLPMLFSAELELAETAKGPVKFEMELQGPSAEAQGQAWILQPGERKPVEFAVPASFAADTDVFLVTRMVRRNDSTEGAHAKWHRPAFRPR